MMMSESTDVEGRLSASLCSLKTEIQSGMLFHAVPELKTPVLEHASDPVLGRQRQEEKGSR